MIADVYAGIDVNVETFPDDAVVNELAYLDALSSFKPGDAVIIFTPDDTHTAIALAAIERGLHVLITKPAVQVDLFHIPCSFAIFSVFLHKTIQRQIFAYSSDSCGPLFDL